MSWSWNVKTLATPSCFWHFNFGTLYFSISHSPSCVICAMLFTGLMWSCRVRKRQLCCIYRRMADFRARNAASRIITYWRCISDSFLCCICPLVFPRVDTQIASERCVHCTASWHVGCEVFTTNCNGHCLSFICFNMSMQSTDNKNFAVTVWYRTLVM